MSISDIAGVTPEGPKGPDSIITDADGPTGKDGTADPKDDAPANSETDAQQTPSETVDSADTATSTAQQNSESSPSSKQPTTPSDTPTTKTDAFLDELMTKLISPKDLKKPPMKVMIFSDPGVGKTFFAGTIPKNLIIDTEEGSLTLAVNKGIIPESTRVYPYKSFQGLDAIIDRLVQGGNALDDFDVLTIDTLSTLHKKGLAEVTTREHKKSPRLVNEFVAETEHHTENNERIRRLVEKIKTYRGSVIINTHVRTLEKKNETSKVFPDFSEKLANTLSGMLDVVGYMYMANLDGEMHRVLRCQPTNSIYAKNRLNLPDNIIDPTWDKLYELSGL